MVSWTAASEEQIWSFINEGVQNLSGAESRFFEAIRVMPHKWQLDPWGEYGKGFWVVGIIGQTVLWYNDIEDGFNHSQYSKFGEIGEYWCDQDSFYFAVKLLKSYVDTGHAHGKMSPPKPIDFTP